MLFSAGKPPERTKETKPIYWWVENGYGFEGVELVVQARAGQNGHSHSLLAVDPEGRVWAGPTLSIPIGYYNLQGEFVWHSPFRETTRG